MARNVTGGSGGKRWIIEFSNLRQVRDRFKEISNTLSGRTGVRMNATAEKILNSQLASISDFLRDKIRAVAAARGVPRRVQASIFSFTDPNAGQTARKQRSTLVGVRKGAPPRYDSKIYVEWQGTGKTIGMSLATLFEQGTKNGRIKPRRYFRTAYFANRGTVLNRLTAAYKKAIESFNPR